MNRTMLMSNRNRRRTTGAHVDDTAAIRLPESRRTMRHRERTQFVQALRDGEFDL